MSAAHDGQMLKSVAIFVFLTIALAFTAYQCAVGYQTAIGLIPAVFLAVLCAGILGLLSISLRARMREGRHTMGIWIGALIVAAVSFAGNFNAFYTGFIKSELIKKELESKRNSLDGIQKSGETALADKRFSELERDIAFLKKELRSQILNEGRPGLGPEAIKVIGRIQTRLGDQLTPESASGSTTEGLTRLADRYDQRIDDKVAAKRIALVQNAEERQKARADNARLYADATKTVDAALTTLASDKSLRAEQDAIAAIEKAVQAYSRIGALTRASLPDSVSFDYDRTMTLVSDKVGHIDHSFNTAKENLNHMAVWLSAFLAFFIDMGVPLVIWLTYSRHDKSTSDATRIESRRGAPTTL